MAFRLLTLGAPALLDAGGSPIDLPLGKPFALAVYLALEPGPNARDDLAALFWPKAPRERARQSVRQALWLLRRTLGPDAIRSDDPVELEPGRLTTDFVDLRAALAAGDVALAMSLWRGPFLDRFAIGGVHEWQLWVEERRDECANAFGAALLEAASTERSAGSLGTAIPLLRRAVSVAPYRAAGHALLIDTLLDARELDAAGAALAEARRQLGETNRGIDFAGLEGRLHAMRATPARVRTGPELNTEFVGRSAELADLLGLWRSARSGHSRAAVITGPTGIGKSRLAGEVAAALDGGTLVTVRASEAERDIHHGLAATLVRQLLRLRGAAGVSGASDAVLRTLVPSLSQGNGIGIGSNRSAGDGGGRPANGLDAVGEVGGTVSTVALADALTDLIGAVAEESPLAVVLDDVHWADSASRSVIASLLRRMHDVPCLFLLTVRPEDSPPELTALLRALGQERGITSVSLGPLAVADVAELLGLMAEFRDNADADRIASRFHAVTGGNPLFLVELARTLHEEGVIKFSEGRWTFHADLLPDELPLPASVRAVIDRRLDQLPPDAAALAGHLARLPAGGQLAGVRHQMNLGEGAFTLAAGELLRREIIRWDSDERVEFTHDQLRQGAIRRFPVAAGSPASGLSAGRGSRHRRTLIAAAALTVAAVPAGLLMRGAMVGPPLYGGGRIYVTVADSLLVLTPPAGRGTWRLSAPDHDVPEGTSTGLAVGPFLRPDGTLYWHLHANEATGPPRALRIEMDGRRFLIAEDSGDVSIAMPSPDGRLVVFLRDDPATKDYDYQLMITDAAGIAPRPLVPSGTRIGSGIWSREGSAIAASTYGVDPARLVVLNPRGETLAEIQLPGPVPQAPVWCAPERIFVAVLVDGAPQLAAVRLPERTASLLDAPPAEGTVLCSPDGRFLAFGSILDGRFATILFDTETRETSVLPVPEGGRLQAWLSPRPPLVAESLEILRAPAQIEWGGSARLSASARMSDGRERDLTVRWETSDSLVASIDAGGQLTANRPGRVLVFATTASWLSDTVEVEVVRGDFVEDLLLEDFSDDSSTLDTARWIVIGDAPAPRPASIDGAPAIQLTGDGQYADGLLLRQPLHAPRGLTVEAEFRMNLTRWDRQSFNVCVADMNVKPGANEHEMSDWIEHERVCFGYPSSSMGASDSTRANVGGLRLTRTASVSPDLPAVDRWVRVAIQMQAGGQVDYYLNGRHIHRRPVAVTDVGTRRWRVSLIGAAVDTRLYVRNLVVWQGTRY